MALKIDDLLRVATSHNASDLHLKVGAFPVMRIAGELHPIENAPRLKPEDSLDMAFSMMSNRQKQRFKEVSEVDIGYGVSDVHFRNFFESLLLTIRHHREGHVETVFGLQTRSIFDGVELAGDTHNGEGPDLQVQVGSVMTGSDSK